MTGTRGRGGGSGPGLTGMGDPLEADPRVKAFFGESYLAMVAFARLLETEGVERGLIGPREVERLWERHLLNCASIVPLLGLGSVADIGSGAGLPGLVVAAMKPEREVLLIEAMARRAEWLTETSERLGLHRVRVIKTRAEDMRDGTTATTVVARAVAPLTRLLPWCDHLMSEGGEMLLLKGQAAEEEVAEAGATLRRRSLVAEVLQATTIEGLPGSTVVRVRRAVG